MPMILWNVDTLDWKTRNTQSTIDSVMKNLKDGDIVLMHDIHSQTIDAKHWNLSRNLKKKVISL